MDRPIVYTGEIPRSQDFLFGQQSAMVALAKLAQGILGQRTRLRGLGCGPTSPASMDVKVAPGEIYQLVDLEATAYGIIAADTTHTILKQGISLDDVQLSCPAPTTAGYSINYLVEVGYLDQDTDALVLPYYNASDPSTPYSGNANSGNPDNTVRAGVCDIKVKAGSAAATGSQTTPAPDAGYIGLYVVTVAYGATTITASDIAFYQDARSVGAPTVDVGTATAYDATSDAYADYEFGKIYRFIPANDNTGACTVDFGPGALSIKLIDGSDPSAGDLVASMLAVLRYDGTNLVLVNPQTLARLDQLQQVDPVAGHNAASGVTTLAATSGTLTAPCKGNAIVMGSVSWDTFQSTSLTISSSLAGLVSLFTSNGPSILGYLPMTKGQSSTFTTNTTNGTSSAVRLSVHAFFQPTP